MTEHQGFTPEEATATEAGRIRGIILDSIASRVGQVPDVHPRLLEGIEVAARLLTTPAPEAAVNESGPALALPVLCNGCGRALVNVGEWCCGRFTSTADVATPAPEAAREECTCPDDAFLTDAPCRLHNQRHPWQRDWGVEPSVAADAQLKADLTAIRRAEQAVDLNAPVSGPAPDLPTTAPPPNPSPAPVAPTAVEPNVVTSGDMASAGKVTPCRCGTDATSLNPAEVVVHRTDAPCFIAPAPDLLTTVQAATWGAHELIGAACLCGNWRAETLGVSIRRGFDQHLRDVQHGTTTAWLT